MTTRRIAALQCTKLFGSLTPEDLFDIARRANDLHLQRGEMLFLSGEPRKVSLWLSVARFVCSDKTKMDANR